MALRTFFDINSEVGAFSRGKRESIYHCSPWAMLNMLSKKLSSANCKAQIDVIPIVIKDAFNLTIENFNKDELIITTAYTGMKPPKLFNRVYCRHCGKHILPKLLKDYKIHLGENQNIQGLISKFDLNIPAALHDVVGFFLHLIPKLLLGQMQEGFLRPTEHAKTTHSEA